MRLHELHINNFKFFPKQDPQSPLLKIDGKNLLIYGENGSGKSTIYWAVYTLLESSFKTTPNDVAKYFQRGGEFNLLNIYARRTQPVYIKLVLKDTNGNNSKEYLINPNPVQINANIADSSIRESGMASDFLNYRMLFRLHHIKHSKNNDLFGWFEDEIFQYVIINQISTTKSIGDVYKELKKGPDKVPDFNAPGLMVLPNPQFIPTPQMPVYQRTIYRNYFRTYNQYKHKVEKFNSRFKNYLRDIIDRANIILRDDFLQNFEFRLNYIPVAINVTPDDLGWQKPEIQIQIPKYNGKRNAVKKAHSFLNEAKWTAIGLSIRFAILEDWTNRPNTAELKALIIDDILLSLDMSNRDVVLDLLLNRYISDYQIILMTHDQTFFEFAKRKINATPQLNNWEFLEMYQDTTSNKSYPLVLSSKTNLEKAKVFFKRKEFAASANHMRKAAEHFVVEFVPKNQQYDRSYNKHNLSRLINKSRAVARIRRFPANLISDLDLMRSSILNPGSHHDVYMPVFQSELESSIKTLETLSTLSGIKL